MCTAITLTTQKGNHLIARSMDGRSDEISELCVIPKGYQYNHHLMLDEIKVKWAFIGMTIFVVDHLIVIDGVNEAGLSCMLLNLPDSSGYQHQAKKGKINVAPYDVSYWILSQFSSIDELLKELSKLNIVDLDEDKLVMGVHWMVKDKSGRCIVIESVKGKLHVYNNKVGVLANEPTFDWHIMNLVNYIHDEPIDVKDKKWGNQVLKPYCQGLGEKGLPGDYSSPSRFVLSAYLRNHVVVHGEDEVAVSQCFNILNHVTALPGAVEKVNQLYYYTHYTSCICLETQTYYYKEINDLNVKVFRLNDYPLEGDKILKINE